MPVINPSVIDSWSELANTKPTSAGDIINLQSYYAGNKYGGGEFVARTGSAVDDGGTICRVTGTNYYWERIIHDANRLDVTHFGALRDGKTDCAEACLRMLAWGDKKGAPYSSIGCQFPAGRFSLGNIDLTEKERGLFRFAGSQVNFGYFGTTMIYLDGTAKDKDGNYLPALLVKARKTDVSSLIIDGRYDKTPNNRGFYKNLTTGGQFVHGSYWRAQNVGGVVFDMLDTLDTRFEEFYSSDCADSVLRTRFSGATWGNWDHSTAIELKNFNIQGNMGPNPALDLPKATQCHLTNGWIEHSEVPGDFSNGGWIIDGLSVEGCKQPFEMTGAMISSRAINLQSGSSIEYNNPSIKEWRPYERGRVQQEAHGIRVHGSLAYNYLHSNIRFKNDSDKPMWIRVGTLRVVEANDMTKFRVIGAHGTEGGVGTLSDYGSDNYGGGEIEVSLRRHPQLGKRLEGSATVTGTCPVADIGFYRPYDNDITVYIQLAPNSGWVNCYFETTAHSRFSNGTPFFWTYLGEQVSDEEYSTLSLYRPRNATALGTMTHGLAIMEDGTLSLKTRQLTSDGKLVVNLNGIYHTLPVQKAAFATDKFMRNAPLSGRGLDNGLGGLFDLKWGNWGVNGGAYSRDGVCYLTQKFKATVGVHTTLEDVEVQFKLLTGPGNIDGVMGASVELRRANWNPDTSAYVLGFMGKDSDGFNKLALFRRIVNADKTIVMTPLQTVAMRCSDNQTLKFSVRGGMLKVFADGVLLGSVEEAEDVMIKGGDTLTFGMWEGNPGITLTDLQIAQPDA